MNPKLEKACAEAHKFLNYNTHLAWVTIWAKTIPDDNPNNLTFVYTSKDPPRRSPNYVVFGVYSQEHGFDRWPTAID